MKSNIVFFDSFENSKKGTYRGASIFPIFILINIAWYSLTKNIYKKYVDDVPTDRLWIAMIISGLLIVSALGIHKPSSVQKAVVYAALVGLVVYGVSNASLLASSNKWDYTISTIDTLWGVISTSLLGLILFYVVKEWPNTFKPI